MTVNSSTFIKDSVLFIRDALATGVTDPLSATRSADQKFVMTAYPQREAVYPIITVTVRNVITDRPLGHSSEGQLVNLNIEVRVWARKVAERDDLAQQVYTVLRQLQLDASTGSNANGLFSFTLTSSVPIDEEGAAGIHSMVSEYRYMAIIN